MSTETVLLNHPKLHRALEARLRLMLLHPAFSLTRKQQARFRRMKLYFNDGQECYTDFHRIVFGLNSSFFKGDINEQYHAAETIGYHENGHLLVTHKPTWDKHCYSSMRIYGPLASFSIDILNVLEDCRMEYLLGLVFPNMRRRFFLLHYRDVENIESKINEELKKETPDASKKLALIRNCLLYMAHTRIVPNIHHTEIKEYLKNCYPYVLYARVGDHTADAVKATEKILEILKPLIEEFKSDVTAKYKAVYKSKETGTSEPLGGGSFEGFSDETDAFEFPEEVEGMMREIVEKVKEELEEEKLEEEEKEDGFKTASPSDETEEEKEEDKEADSEPKGTGDTDASSLRDFVEDIANNLDLFEKYKKDLDAISKEIKEEIKAPVTHELLEELLHSTKKERKQNFKMKKEAKTMEELDVKIETELHKSCEAYFKKRGHMDMFTPHEYEQIVRSLNQIIKRTVSQIREISQMAIENTLRHQRSGRLDRRMIVNHQAFGESKIFRNKEIETKQLQLEVMLLIDVSGSNMAQIRNDKNDTRVPRYVMNQTVAILLHEILKKLRFHHTIWTFDEGSKREQRFSSPVDRSNCFDKEAGRYIKEVTARSNNRDGYAIRYAGEYLNRLSENPHRLLIVLSDGQPAGANYGGHTAIEDVRQAVKEVQKKGSKVLGIFTGHESENNYFIDMYGENAVFCNNESIFDLPKILKKILLDEFQEIVSQTV